MNILTIDLEDWFHILDHNETASPGQWDQFESRVEANTEWMLEKLSEAKQHATFFCLGWIAERHPGLIRKIAGQGHEIACHSMNHQLVYNQEPAAFENDLKECLRLLEDVSGQSIRTYRAPGFSVTESSRWIFEILVACGIENDCSVFPMQRNHGGYSSFPSGKPCTIPVNGKDLREFPMSASSVAGKKIVFSGGGYFRLLPYSVIRYLVLKSDYVMTYFHPRDFDPEQPVLSSLSLKRRFMSYIGLKGAKDKFETLLKDFRFVNVAEAAEKIQWDKVPSVQLN